MGIILFMKIFQSLFLAFLLFCNSFVFAETSTSDNIESVNTTKITQDARVEGQSELVNALCTLILILNGRIARVIAAVAIFAIGIMFFMGKITWQIIVTIGIALGLVFGAKNVAILLLPRAVHVYDTHQGDVSTKTTSQIITQSCPELL
jgi:type IV secretory pathway VirB2 component (pilin)